MSENFLTALLECEVLHRYEWLETVPRVSAGRFLGADDVGDNTYVLCWEEVSREEYLTYAAELKGAGFEECGEYALGDNRYLALVGAAASLYVSYIPATRALRVYAEEKGASMAPSDKPQAYTAVANYQPTLWQLPVDCKGSKANGGMSYVVKVADGSFVIIDGGYPTEYEATELYRFLCSQVAEGEKPVVSAWFLTHPHGDHYGCLQVFTKLYRDAVTVKAFYYNLPWEGHGMGHIQIPQWLYNDMSQWEGAQIYRKLHTGMTVYVADARFDVIFTHEDIYPVTGTDANDTSLVLRMTLGGQRVMFLADIEERASKIITATVRADELKAELVQLAHHGYEGATIELYDLIGAPTVLWPMNIYGWQRPDKSNVFERWSQIKATRRQELANAYLRDDATYVEKIIVAGAGLAEVRLPYTPEGEKLPDYQAIHDAIAAVEEPQEA